MATFVAASLLFSAGCAEQHPMMRSAQARAESGFPAAWHTLCHSYFYGRNTRRDYEQALHWCTKSTEKGDPSSMTLLAEIYFNGLGAEPDPARAFELYKEAARVSHPHAQHMLGHMYSEGIAVAADQEHGALWKSRSKRQGYDPERPGVVKTLSPDSISKAAPCQYQGTFHKKLRWEIEQGRMASKISDDTWYCQARALEVMDAGLREACASGPDAVDDVLKAREARFAVCAVNPPEPDVEIDRSSS